MCIPLDAACARHHDVELEHAPIFRIWSGFEGRATAMTRCQALHSRMNGIWFSTATSGYTFVGWPSQRPTNQSMVARVCIFATTGHEPRQARKGAAVEALSRAPKSCWRGPPP